MDYETGFTQGYNRMLPSGNIAVTVYVYRRRADAIPDGPGSAMVHEQISETIAALEEIVGRGDTYHSMSRVARDASAIGDLPRSPKALRASFLLDIVGGPRVLSTVLVTGAQDHFVKVRITQPGVDLDQESKALRPVLNAIGEALL